MHFSGSLPLEHMVWYGMKLGDPLLCSRFMTQFWNLQIGFPCQSSLDKCVQWVFLNPDIPIPSEYQSASCWTEIRQHYWSGTRNKLIGIGIGIIRLGFRYFARGSWCKLDISKYILHQSSHDTCVQWTFLNPDNPNKGKAVGICWTHYVTYIYI